MSRNYWTESTDNIFVAAHRGLSVKYPENTMEAFRAAASCGVDQIETDVRMTKDRELIIMHDAKVDRTTDGSGFVHDFTLSEIKRLDAGVKAGAEFTGYRVPAFREFLSLCREYDVPTIDVELKEYPENGNDEIAYECCDRAIEMIEEFGYGDRCVLNTFSGKLHEYIFGKYGRKYRQHVYYPISYMGKGMTMDPAEYAFCVCMFRSWWNGDRMNIGTPEEFQMMAEKGIEPWAGACVKDEEGVERAIKAGARLITVNNGDEILSILRKKGKHQ